jgi:hypothetical protein
MKFNFCLIVLITIFVFNGQESFGQKRKTKKERKKEYLERVKKDSINGVYIPVDLNDCFNQINSFWTDSVKVQVREMNEEEFIGNSHFGIGLWMRNNWGLWGGSRLSKYFNLKGINHPDDMSGIILTSYYRQLTGQEIKLEDQIQYYQDYWKKNE